MASSYLRDFISNYGAALPLMMGLDTDYRLIKDDADYTRNVRQEFPHSTVPAVIAVLGLPFTGRDFVCEMLGVWLGCPVYDVQAPFNILTKVEDDDDGADPEKVSFDVVCRMAGCHLSGRTYGLNCAIVASSLFDYKWQVDRLLDVTYELQIRANRTSVCTPQIVVVECFRRNKFQWRLSAAVAWKDVEKAYDQLQGGDDEFDFVALSREYSSDIKKLVVDPFEDISHMVSEFGGRGYSALFARGIKYLLTCDDERREEDEEVPVLVDYMRWRRQQLEQRRGGWIVAGPHKWCRPGDCVFRFTDRLGLNSPGRCAICEKEVKNEAYHCQFCSLTLHQHCATKEPHLLDLSYKCGSLVYGCYSCIDQGREFSASCESCLLRTFIKSLPLPLIFNHKGGDDHPLCLRLVDELSPYICKACGLFGKLASYGCHICKAQYHLGCLRAPSQTENRHGGHMHTMDRRFSCGVEDDEYEWCLACYADIDPETWVYTCLDCDYGAHLYCIIPSIVMESEHQIF